MGPEGIMEVDGTDTYSAEMKKDMKFGELSSMAIYGHSA